MPATQVDLATLKAIIVEKFPELADAHFRLLAQGWDSVAVDVDEQLIFKFPRHPSDLAALRREAGILALVGPVVSMPVPVLTMIESPAPFSRHRKIPGDHLLAVQYAGLNERQRDRMADQLGQFYAELHSIAVSSALAAGAEPVDTWLDAETILRRVWPVLPLEFRPFAERTMAGWAALPPDPLGQVYGFFDGHGWNMAFDHAQGQLNGIYDFAVSGIGPRQQEFIYSNFISPDLTARIIAAYEQYSVHWIDRDRVALLTGAHRLWELAAQADDPDHLPDMIASIAAWANLV